MGWRTIAINVHSKLSYRNGSLVFRSDSQIEKISLSEIGIVIIETTDVVITSALVAKLVDNKTKLIFCDDKRLPSAEIVPYYGAHDTSRSLQKQVAWTDSRRAKIWREVVRQKILNQAIFLELLELLPRDNLLRSYAENIEDGDISNREGHAAKVYFNQLFGKEFLRGGGGDVNAALDYGYTLLLSLFSREIVSDGYITQLGINHHNYFNQFNLASDLMEPFRVLVDEIVHTNRELEFAKIKRQLLTIFDRTYVFDGKNMHLDKIAEIYVKKILDALSDDELGAPEFVYRWEKA